MPTTASSLDSSRTAGWERDILPLDICLPSSEIEDQPDVFLRVNDLMIEGSISTDGLLFMDATHRGDVGSMAMDTSAGNAHDGHTCSVCLKSFSSPLQLWIHSPIHKKTNRCERVVYRGKMTLKHECPTCLKTFCSPSKLKRHFLIHTGQKPFSCAFCDKAFRQEVHLKSHLITACSLSQRTERKTQRLLKRPSGHSAPASWSVEPEPQCAVGVRAMQVPFKTETESEAALKPEQSFDGHSRRQDIRKNQKGLRSHTAVGGAMNNVSQSSAHTQTAAKTSSPEPDLGLNIVVKSESWSENLIDRDSPLRDVKLTAPPDLRSVTRQATGHQRRKHTLRQCHACAKTFPSLSKLQRHVMTHTGQRPFSCHVCEKRFRQKTHLRVHLRTHLWSKYHKQRSSYISRPPSRTARQSTRLAAGVSSREVFAHSKKSEKRLDQATRLQSVWKDTNRESAFLLAASQKNEVAPFSEVYNTTLKMRPTAKAMQRPSNVQHTCAQCFKCFPSASKLQRHAVVHTGLKPFPCVVCGKTFRQAAYLKVHERTRCTRRPPKPVQQQGRISNLRVKSQQQLYPRISIHLPPQKKSMKIGAVHSQFADALSSRGKHEQLSTRSEIASTKVNNLMKGGSMKNKVVYGKRTKNLSTPYKPSRHDLQDEYLDVSAPETFISAHLHDYNEDEVGVQSQSPTSAGHYFLTDVYSHRPEALDTERLAGLPEEEMESGEEKQSEHSNWAPELYSHSSFPFEHASEVHRLVQNEKAAGPSPSRQEKRGTPSSMGIPFQPSGVTANSGSQGGLDGGLASSVLQNQVQAALRDYWCEPLMFECDNCRGSFETETDLRRHICNSGGRPKLSRPALKYHCNMCFKSFVSPSKLKRHYVTHTGQRPFMCDVCGKTFTQLTHLRTHQRTH